MGLKVRDPKDLELEYVFEIVRHGARAPMVDDSERFPRTTSLQMLTPMGMRQRYLLGKHNKMMYLDKLNATKDELFIESTDVYRTIQSGYSEMMGMFEGKDRLQISDKQRSALKTGRGAPPMSITNATEIDTQLANYAIVEGYAGFPLHTYIEDNWEDDLGYGVCPQVNEISAMRDNNDTYYADLVPLKGEMSELFATEFNVSASMIKNLTVHYLAAYADIVFSERFEGIKQKVDWSLHWDNIKALLDSVLLNPYSNYARNLMITKQLMAPITEIQEITMGIGAYTGPKYRLYSAHDTNIANVLKQINPTFVWHGILYASNIYFEVYKDKNSGAHSIRTMYNGKPLILETCKQEFCTPDQFMFQMQSQLTLFNYLRDECFSKDSENQYAKFL